MVHALPHFILATAITLFWFAPMPRAQAQTQAVTANATTGAIVNPANFATANDLPTLTGNNTYSGANTFSSVNIGPSGIGWRYNPALSGQTEIAFPGGVAAFYQSGNPTRPVFYFPGTIVAETMSANFTSISTFNGTLGPTAIDSALSSMSGWLPNNYANAGMWHSATGYMSSDEPIPPLTYYYPVGWIEDGGTEYSNAISYKWRSPTQLRTDLLPTATAALDWPSIPASSTSTLTLPLTAATITGTPTIALGWSASLPTGISVSQSWVSANGTVSISLTNITPAEIDPPAITVRATLIAY